MPGILPPTHVVDALKLEAADGKIDLFELTPLSGGTIYFKNDNDVTWQTRTYEGLPLTLSGEEADLKKTPEPQMVIGQDNLDLLAFKGLINDGHLEGGTIVRKRVLLDDLLANRNIKQTTYFRIKRVEGYSRTQVTLVLSSYSSATRQTIPFRQYVPPAFPWVDI